MRNYFLLIAILVVFSFCTNLIDNSNNSNQNTNNNVKLVYSNEFELNDDLNLWKGISKENISSDGHLSKSSLLLNGGCIQPTAMIEYEVQEDGTYYVNLFGKTIEQNQSANVIFSNTAMLSNMKTLDIKGNLWKAYQSDTLQFKKGDKVKVEFIVGGFVPVNTLIDHFKIYKVN